MEGQERKGALYNPWILGIGTALLAGFILQVSERLTTEWLSSSDSGVETQETRDVPNPGSGDADGVKDGPAGLERKQEVERAKFIAGVGVIVFTQDGQLDSLLISDFQNHFKSNGVKVFVPKNDLKIKELDVKIGDHEYLSRFGMPFTEKVLWIQASKTVVLSEELEGLITTELELIGSLSSHDGYVTDGFRVMAKGVGFSEKRSYDVAIDQALEKVPFQRLVSR